MCIPVPFEHHSVTQSHDKIPFLLGTVYQQFHIVKVANSFVKGTNSRLKMIKNDVWSLWKAVQEAKLRYTGYSKNE